MSSQPIHTRVARRWRLIALVALVPLAVVLTTALAQNPRSAPDQVGLLNAAAAPDTPGPATRGWIQWRSGAAAVTPQSSDEIVTVLAAAASGDARHVVVQFDGPVTAALRERLEAAGLMLLRYVSDQAFFAVVSPATFNGAALATVESLIAAEPIERDWKLHPDLVAGKVASWSVVAAPKDKPLDELTPGDNPLVGAYVLFHPDVDLDEAASVVHLLGGRIRSALRSVNGLVIELPYINLYALADADEVQWIEPPLPRFSELNDDNRLRTGANIVQQPPYGLNGSGVTVLVYDGGYGYAAHPDFGGRLTVRDSSGLSDHATHVSGTVGGSGAGSGGTYRGMATAVTIQSYGFEQEGGLHEGFLYTDPGDLEADYSQAINTYGADISNNSIGTNTAPNGFPCDWEGNYGVTDVLIDTIVRGDGSNPLFDEPFRIVWANGNERQTSRCLGVEGFPSPYHSTAPPACGKNHITVGALNSNDDSVTDFTSFGPADDGRMKPDVSAPGCQSNGDAGVTSCSSSGGYTVKCGTSMACPTTCGLGALLLQDFRQQYPGEPDFRNSTLKVLFAHTATDIVNPGPDYQTGYGSIRIQPAVELLRAGNFLEDSVGQGETFQVLVVAGPSDPQIKVTLAWDDVPGTPNVNPVLVNDLDLRVFDSSNTRYYPWTLSPTNPSANAVQTQENHRDNIEQVVINSPTPGAYRIEVYGYNVPSGPQSFSIAATPLLVACSPQGIVSLDRNKYACTSSATVQVVDCDLNTDDQVIETVQVTIASDTESAGEVMTLIETAPETAAFRGTIALSETNAPGVLQISDGDTVTVTYIDADDGQGGQNVVVTDTAVVDCSPPVISDVQVAEINPRDATITFTTDELANGTVRYGLSCGALTESVGESGYKTSHSIKLTGLTDSTTYFFAIDAEDEAGNAVTDNNGGACYNFATPEIPDYFTEEYGSDNDTDNLTAFFSPNGSVDFYGACVEAATAYPTDPAGGTVVSLTDDSYATANLSGGATVKLYGVSYSTLYIGSNGYLTFTAGDTDYTETLADHFDTPRVSALFDDLIPGSGTISWKQLADRVAVTWNNVSEISTTNSNSFQIELFFNGDIHVTWLGIAAADGIAGLSAGTGLPVDFFETDLSGLGVCGPKPPTAQNVSTSTGTNTPVTVTLVAQDDGLPEPPALSYIIAMLPANGDLSDPNGGAIASVPYTLLANGDQVTYTPDDFFNGTDYFQFRADDGGTPPEGGPSNLATVTVDVGGPGLIYDFPLSTNPGWSVQGAWAYGQPTGGGSGNGDPTSGHTGPNVYGFNLNGNYTFLTQPRYLTTAAIDCSLLEDVSVRFWRWLGVESNQYDHATVEVSNDSVNWTVVWSNPTTDISDSAWSLQTLDLSAVADHRPTVYVRWGMGPTDFTTHFPGWNVDDVQIWGTLAGPLYGDMNCDGLVNSGDIPHFIQAIVDQASYAADHDGDPYPPCDITHGDVNQDGYVNAGDIPAFVDLLTQ